MNGDSTKSLRILHTVEFYSPSTGGSEEAVRQVSERLVRRGHEVTVATTFDRRREFSSLNGVKIVQFKVSGNSVKGISGDVREYQDFVEQSAFDVIVNYAAQTWTTDVLLPLLPRLRGRKYFIPLGYSKLHKGKYRQYYRDLPQALRAYEKLIHLSPSYQDRRQNDAWGFADKVVVIPNGVSLDEFAVPSTGFRERYGISERFLFVTVANHYFGKGHFFVLEAMRLLGRKDCALAILGEPPTGHPWYSCYPLCMLSGLVSRHVHVLRGVPRTLVVSALQESDLFLFGSKVECAPLVMYEAFASGSVFVSTPVGNVPDHTPPACVVATPAEMAATVQHLLGEDKLRQSLAEEGKRLVREVHNWDVITHRYERLFLE